MGKMDSCQLPYTIMCKEFNGVLRQQVISLKVCMVLLIPVWYLLPPNTRAIGRSTQERQKHEPYFITLLVDRNMKLFSN